MFERFTDRARESVVQAQVEARELRHGYIGTEHLLLGILREETFGPGALDRRVRPRWRSLGRGRCAPISGHIPFTPRAKKVLELSLREAVALGHNYIGTEHILLGLVREREGIAAQLLQNRGAGDREIRRLVAEEIGEKGQPGRSA